MEMTYLAHHDELRGCNTECSEVARHLAWIGDRWTLPVVVTLSGGTLRFNQLKRAVGGISQQMLTRTLRSLERDGMVKRTVHPTVPPQVEYELTDLGHSLARQGLELGRWVHVNRSKIDAHRQLFDQRNA